MYLKSEDRTYHVPDGSSISGGSKVYVRLEPPLTYERWIEGFRAGRAFVSNGPLVSFTVDGQEPGAEINLAGAKRLSVEADAVSLVPMEVLELVVNGEFLAQAKPGTDGTTVKLSHVLELDRSAWVAARARGGGHLRVMNDPKLFAHTNPVYCLRDGKPVALAKDAAIVLGWIDRLIDDVKASPRFATEARRQEVLDAFQRGRRHYEQIATAR